MSIPLNDNIKFNAPKLADDRSSFEGARPYVSVAEALAKVPKTRRSIGLMFFVQPVPNEKTQVWWFSKGIEDADIEEWNVGSGFIPSILRSRPVKAVKVGPEDFEYRIVANETNPLIWNSPDGNVFQKTTNWTHETVLDTDNYNRIDCIWLDFEGNINVLEGDETPDTSTPPTYPTPPADGLFLTFVVFHAGEVPEIPAPILQDLETVTENGASTPISIRVYSETAQTTIEPIGPKISSGSFYTAYGHKTITAKVNENGGIILKIPERDDDAIFYVPVRINGKVATPQGEITVSGLKKNIVEVDDNYTLNPDHDGLTVYVFGNNRTITVPAGLPEHCVINVKVKGNNNLLIDQTETMTGDNEGYDNGTPHNYDIPQNGVLIFTRLTSGIIDLTGDIL